MALLEKIKIDVDSLVRSDDSWKVPRLQGRIQGLEEAVNLREALLPTKGGKRA